MKESVFEFTASNLNSQLITDGEVTGSQCSRLVLLAEEDWLARAVQGLPLLLSGKSYQGQSQNCLV